jgi:hypothetical protein
MVCNETFLAFNVHGQDLKTNNIIMANTTLHDLILRTYQMDFWFEFCDIHMNEKITSHNCHGFKWQNINIYFHV